MRNINFRKLNLRSSFINHLLESKNNVLRIGRRVLRCFRHGISVETFWYIVLWSEHLSNNSISFISQLHHLLVKLFKELVNHFNNRLNELVGIWQSTIKNIVKCMGNLLNFFMKLLLEILSADVFTLHGLVPFVIKATDVGSNFSKIGY